MANVWRLPKLKLRRLNSSELEHRLRGAPLVRARRRRAARSRRRRCPRPPGCPSRPPAGGSARAPDPARPSVVSTAPSQSRRTWRRAPLRLGTAIATSPSVSSTNGTLMAKIQRHDAVSTSQPPASGPITIAMPDQAVQEPIAPPRSSRRERGDDHRERARGQQRAEHALQRAAGDQDLDRRRDRAHHRDDAEPGDAEPRTRAARRTGRRASPRRGSASRASAGRRWRPTADPRARRRDPRGSTAARR